MPQLWGSRSATSTMINLIPNQEKKKKVKDFYFRLAVVTLFMFALGLLVAMVAIFPAFILSATKKGLVQEKLQRQRAEAGPVLREGTRSMLEDIKQKLDLVDKVGKNKYVVSEKVVTEIINKKISGMKITQILFEVDPIKGKKVSLRGVAGSREQLLEFRRALETDILFKQVDLPISNFVKGSNIDFSLTLIPV